MSPHSCPCFSGLLYENCCKPFHEGKTPKTALELMRSRFSAYSLHLPAYIIATTATANPDYNQDIFSWSQNIAKFCQMTQFKNLEILRFKEEGNRATVTFIASLVQNGKDVSFKEESLFEKNGGIWLYVKGKFH